MHSSDGEAPPSAYAEEQQANEQQIQPAPQGWQRLLWLGPNFLWMLSAAGSGELLFTPRIAAQYCWQQSV